MSLVRKMMASLLPGVAMRVFRRRVEHCLGILDKSKSVIWRNERRGSEKYPFHARYWSYDDYLALVRMPLAATDIRATHG